MTCPYQTARYRRGCTITVPHLHWPKWAEPIRRWRDKDGIEYFEHDNLALFMVNRWWPQSRERAA